MVPVLKRKKNPPQNSRKFTLPEANISNFLKAFSVYHTTAPREWK